MLPKMKQCIFLNNMNDTLRLLDELLEHDSGSKIFFPLARMYKKQGDTARAIAIIRKGLGFHPDYLEAQLFLIELLHDSDANGEAETIAQSIYAKFSHYGSFWTTLRSSFAKSDRSELIVAAFLFEQASKSQKVDFFSLLESGISQYSEAAVAPFSAIQEPENDLDAEEVTQICINSGIKTKTMARLLLSQGEYEQSIRIYDELIGTCADPTERAELVGLRSHAQCASGLQNVQEPEQNIKIYKLLSTLADRLEQRISS